MTKIHENGETKETKIHIKFTVKCECDHEAVLSVPDRKVLILRGNLEAKGFYLDTTDMHDNEIRVHCNKCKSWVTIRLN